MPFPDPILPLAFIVLLASGISMWVINSFSSTSSRVQDTHTHFTLSQITERLDEVEDVNFPRTTTELLSTLRASSIDWNSCKIEGDRIVDSWGQPIAVTFDGTSETWTFRSLGKDSEIGTEDDIEIATTGK